VCNTSLRAKLFASCVETTCGRLKNKKLFQNIILGIIRDKRKSFITASSITDIYYVLRKAKGHEDTIVFLKNTVNIIKVIGVDDEVIANALNSEK